MSIAISLFSSNSDITPLGDSIIRLIATTISKTIFDDTYRTTLSARAKDTGLWLLGDDRFKDWVGSDPADGILWLIGERKPPYLSLLPKLIHPNSWGRQDFLIVRHIDIHS
jgi:hypothetical protein